MLYVEALGRLASDAGMKPLVDTSLYDDDDEVRLSALDQVITHRYKPAVGQYIQALRHKDNPIVNRAAVGLGRLKDPSAIAPLIGAGDDAQLRSSKGPAGPNPGGFWQWRWRRGRRLYLWRRRYRSPQGRLRKPRRVASARRAERRHEL